MSIFWTFNMTARLHLWFFWWLLPHVFQIVQLNSDFKVIWNVPIDKCEGKFAVPLGLDKYDIIYNSNNLFLGENMTIFYNFGKFPHISENGTYINGGLPQLGDLEAHRLRVIRDIITTIPNSDFKGYGVLDWEAWRPTWDMNFSFKIYRTESIKLVKSQHPDWSEKEIKTEALEQFEKAARDFMEVALTAAQSLRPNGLWGYYQFPECVNHATLRKDCEPNAIKSNNEMRWLYSQSTALYPSIYIGSVRTTAENAVNVWGKLNESSRVADNQTHYVPVYPYTILHYARNDQTPFLKLNDLLVTMGQTAALRKFSGVVIWGSWISTNTKEKCENLQQYIHDILGPTIKHIKAVYAENREPLVFPTNLPATEWGDKIIQYFS